MTDQKPKVVAVAVGVPLQGLDEAYRLSQNLSLAAVLPRDLRGKPADVLAILLYGQEIGLAPMQAVQGIYVVNGRPTLSAQTWLALVRRAGHQATVKENSTTKAVVFMRRGDTGEEHTEEYTFDDATTAKLTGKDVWKQHPKRMLLARAVSNAAKFICPEVALGFYSEADIDDLKADVVPDTIADSDVQRPIGAEADDEPVDAEVVADEVAGLAEQFDFAAKPGEGKELDTVWPEVTAPGSAE